MFSRALVQISLLVKAGHQAFKDESNYFVYIVRLEFNVFTYAGRVRQVLDVGSNLVVFLCLNNLIFFLYLNNLKFCNILNRVDPIIYKYLIKYLITKQYYIFI